MRLLAFVIRRGCSNTASTSHGVLRLGNVEVPVQKTKRTELVPAGFASEKAPPEVLKHLKWLLQKDILRQDVFLLGPPGLLRSHLVLQYLELINREYEYLSVTRDTTEADIKQRREIRSGSALYSDLCAVRAALEGRVLIIDGVERAERNVLPILNNLLENREMQLDDGRFLMKHDAYDKLLKNYTVEELRAMGVERVSERFHVVALGLPVPKFPGHTLDPPLRSRFQCRHVPPLSFHSISTLFKAFAPSINTDNANNFVSLAYALNSQDQLTLPTFPIDNILKAAKIWEANPGFTADELFRMFYPLDTIMKANERSVVEDFMRKFNVWSTSHSRGSLKNVHLGNQANVLMDYNSRKVSFEAPRGKATIFRDTKYISNEHQERLLSEVAVSHSNGDFGLLGPKGCGKTVVVDEFAKRFGYAPETMVLYQDLSSRELLQRRKMLENGDTVWEDSILVTAARSGGLCVLDGIERVHASALEVLAPLIHFRHLDLPDGSRLISSSEFEVIKQKTSMTEDELAKNKVFPIPDTFRLLLVGDSECGEHPWLSDPILALVPFHTLQALPIEQQIQVVNELVPEAHPGTVRQLIECVEGLRASQDAGLRGVATSLSLRKLVHIARRDALHAGELRSLVESAALTRFLPSITKTAFSTALDKAGMADVIKKQSDYKEDVAALRHTTKPGEEALVPSVLFYHNAQHTKALCDLARDFRLRSHLLLIGNQGVGKNKLVDMFLQLINRPRQYMQLHRDTTVESLTIQTTIEGGVLKHDDSALVKAARCGHVLVVDEADKAPLHVIAILKSLLDSGTLMLGDGRRIQPAHFPAGENTISLHPEFRIIMLANRPGFPFLGNDLFGVLGDLFSVHTVDNPTRDSELAMLGNYGPNVCEEHLMMLVTAFSELRNMADNGLLQYPYSTRELVNIVKHANKFPKDPLATIVGNVFDFDQYDEDVVKTIQEVFQRHGIPLG